MNAALQCMNCRHRHGIEEILYTCPSCGGLLDVVYDGSPGDPDSLKSLIRARRASDEPVDRSGVWRFRELIPFLDERHVVTLEEGNTPLWRSAVGATWAGVERLAFKHQGMNPTGSFKDNGMTTGVSQAARL